MRRHKLRKAINWPMTLKQIIIKQLGIKQGLGVLGIYQLHFGKMQFIQMFTTCLCKQKFKVFEVEHLTHKCNFVEKAEATLEHLKPRNAVMPVNPMYTAEEWQEIYAAQKRSPEYSPNFKQGTEP